MKYPGGTPDYSSWLACTDHCATSCLPGQNWQCLDQPIIWPKPKGVANISFSVTFEDFLTERPFVGSMVKACGKLDFNCTNPIDQATTDQTGRVTLKVSPGLVGFDGYLDIRGGNVDGTGSPVFPALLYPLPYVIADGWRGRNQIPSVEEFPFLAAETMTELDPARGHFAANAADCSFTLAPGVSFETDYADSASVSFYTVAGIPSPNSTVTDSSAVGGFLNLPPGLPLIKAFSSGANGKTMGSFTFIIRAGTLTTTGLFPPLP
jgi:hypothetical protein